MQTAKLEVADLGEQAERLDAAAVSELTHATPSAVLSLAVRGFGRAPPGFAWLSPAPTQPPFHDSSGCPRVPTIRTLCFLVLCMFARTGGEVPSAQIDNHPGPRGRRTTCSQHRPRGPPLTPACLAARGTARSGVYDRYWTRPGVRATEVRGVTMRRPRSHRRAGTRRPCPPSYDTARPCQAHVPSPCRYLYSSAAEMSESPLLGRATRPGCTGCNSTLMATMYAGVTSLRARRRSLQPA